MKIHVASPPQSLTSLWMHDLHTALCESPVTQSTISWFGEMMKPPKNLTLFESIVTKNQLTWLKYLEKIEKYLEQGLIKGFPKSPHASTMGPLFFFQVQSWRSSDHQRRQDRNGQDCLVFFFRSCFEHAVNDSSHVETTCCAFKPWSSLKSLHAGEALQNSRWAVRNLRNLLWCRFDWHWDW